MSFDNHIFISYAHIDNKPLTQDTTGWVSRFHESLENFVSSRMGENTRIWRDPKLQGNEIFDKEIFDQLPNSALLVSVVTPRYIESQYCRDEAFEFCQFAEEHGGVFVGNRARVFKVIKTPVESEEPLPDVMKTVLGYQFYRYDDNVPVDLDPVFGDKYRQDYLLKVNKLAWELTDIIKKLEVGSKNGGGKIGAGIYGSETPQDKGVIYLAETSYEMLPAREQLETELEVLGFTVLPRQDLPRDEKAYKEEAARLICQSDLSIHLVGSKYGAVLQGPSEESIGIIQNSVAVEESKKRGLNRIVWIQEGTGSENSQQQKFIDELHSVEELQFGADLVTGEFEELKTTIHNKLKYSANRESQPLIITRNQVYLACIQDDLEKTIPLRKLLKGKGFDVKLPAFEGGATQVRTTNQESIASSCGVLLFYGAGSDAWKKSIDSELRKCRGFQKNSEYDIPIWVFLTSPITEDKKDLVRMAEPNLLNSMDGYDEQDIEALVLNFGDPTEAN